MSLAGYLGSRVVGLRRVVVTEEWLVVAGAGSARVECGADRIWRDGVAAVWEGNDGGLGEFYGSVEEYDPILAWHCRLR